MIINQSICSGCNQPIVDPYILKVDNRKWCNKCLICTKCKCPLNDKCWFKQNKFYCKDDYNELIQHLISCSICKKPIEKNTLKYTIFNRNMHLQCMKCYECDKLLSSGDQFIVISDNKFACTNHLNNQQYLKLESKNEKEQFDKSVNYRNDKPALDTILENNQHLNNSINNHHLDQHNLNDNSMNLIDYSNNFNYLNNNDEFSTNLDNQLPASNVNENYSSFINNYWTQVNYNQNSPLNENKQFNKNKVRRKKLQTSNFRSESESNCNESTFDIALYEQDNLNDSNSIINFKNLDLISPSSSNHHNQNSNSSSASSSINSDFSNSSNSSTNFSSKITSSLKSNTRTNQSLKTKRLRTSFKAYQLKELKNYFQLNQNPDSKQLCTLSQQIKIPKRVLQVWFQNSRASYRKKTQTSYNPKFKNYNSAYEISN